MLHLLKYLRKFSRKKNHGNQCQGFLHFFVVIIIITTASFECETCIQVIKK